MPIRPLSARRVAKPWGRRDLGDHFDRVEDGFESVGEIWFDADTVDDLPLMIKYIFTSERLSVQVHPDDTAAKTAGYPRGKDEAWYILSAHDGATVALGTREVSSREAIAAAAINGEILDLLSTRRVHPGQTIYNAAGTIHAIGAGISLVEVQQNVDLTYRLYDYGRPRPLHLAEAIAVVDPVPCGDTPPPVELEGGRRILCEGGKFVIERWDWHGTKRVSLPAGMPGWFAPLTGEGLVDGNAFAGGQCWLADDAFEVDLRPGSEILFAYPQADRLPLFVE